MAVNAAATLRQDAWQNAARTAGSVTMMTSLR